MSAPTPIATATAPNPSLEPGSDVARPDPLIAVIDYGSSNLVSIAQALTFVGAEVRIAQTAAGLKGADVLVVPGVGAAAPAMRRLGRARLVDPILGWIEAGRPFLGVCLGMQLLFDASDEDGAETLGVIAGRTIRLRDAPTLPHIGWNQVETSRAHPLFAGIPSGTDLYFVHSFAGRPDGTEAEDVVLAETTHGAPFVSAVARANVLGVQFHPERSGTAGLRLLANFLSWATSGMPADDGHVITDSTTTARETQVASTASAAAGRG